MVLLLVLTTVPRWELPKVLRLVKQLGQRSAARLALPKEQRLVTSSDMTWEPRWELQKVLRSEMQWG